MTDQPVTHDAAGNVRVSPNLLIRVEPNVLGRRRRDVVADVARVLGEPAIARKLRHASRDILPRRS